ncbi:MAG: YdjY domain-containing protein [Nitrospirota bacterium]
MERDFLKHIGTGILVTIVMALLTASVFADSHEKKGHQLIAKVGSTGIQNFPTRENPVIVDEKGKRVLIYTEVHEMNVHQPNVHWGVVFKEGKYQDRAILKAYAHNLDFYDGLIKIGAKPGNTLTKETVGKHVEGDTLNITATWPGLGKELSLNEIFWDEQGKDFHIKFGGNRKASEEQKTGCITCLESCWIAVSSNASYPQTGTLKRFINPNSRYKGRAEVLPTDGKPVILIYRVAHSK